MRRTFALCSAILLAFLFGACGSPTSPSGAREGATWTVNGESFQATSNGLAASRSGTSLGLTMGDCGRGPFLSIFIANADFSAPATYTAVGGSDAASITWNRDARVSNSDSWMGPGTTRLADGRFVRLGNVSVIVTNISSDWVSGTFTAEAVASPENADTGTKTIQGSFELSFRQRVIC